MFFIVLSTLALLRAVRPGASRAWWGIYALAAAGAAYSHYTAIFVLAGQAIWSLWLARDRNLLPVRHEWHELRVSKTVPTGVFRVSELREIRPALWFPFKARDVAWANDLIPHLAELEASK